MTKRAKGRVCLSFIGLFGMSCAQETELGSSQASGALANAVAYAKSQGQTSTQISIVGDDFRHGVQLDDVARSYSFLVVVPESVDRVTSIGSAVSSWSVLRLEQALQTKPPVRYPACLEDIPGSLQLAEQQLALPLARGTATVDGIAVTTRSAHDYITIESGRRYLVIANLCTGNVVRVPYAHQSVFLVSDSGAIAPIAPPDARFAEEVVRLGTLHQLSDRLRKGQ